MGKEVNCKTHVPYKGVASNLDTRLPSVVHPIIVPNRRFDTVGDWVVIRQETPVFDPHLVYKRIETLSTDPMSGKPQEGGFKVEVWSDSRTDTIEHLHMNVFHRMRPQGKKVLNRYRDTWNAKLPPNTEIKSSWEGLMEVITPVALVELANFKLILPVMSQTLITFSDTDFTPPLQHIQESDQREEGTTYSLQGTNKTTIIEHIFATIDIPDDPTPPKILHDEDGAVIGLVPSDEGPVTSYQIAVGVELLATNFSNLKSAVGQLIQSGPLTEERVRMLVNPYVNLIPVDIETK